MDLLREVCEEPAVRRVCPVVNLEHYRHVDMPDTRELSRQDVIDRAKAMGVRDYRDRVVLAIQNDEIRQTMGKLYSRDEVDEWIDAELAVDVHEDLHTISLSQARALAREGGLENYSMAVLNAITRQEIDGVVYRRNQPRIPLAAFETWLEDQGMPAADDELVRLDPELQALLDSPAPAGAVLVEAVKMYLVPVVVVIGSLWVIRMVLG